MSISADALIKRIKDNRAIIEVNIIDTERTIKCTRWLKKNVEPHLETIKYLDTLYSKRGKLRITFEEAQSILNELKEEEKKCIKSDNQVMRITPEAEN